MNNLNEEQLDPCDAETWESLLKEVNQLRELESMHLNRLSKVEADNKKLREEVSQAIAYYETEKPGNSFRLMCLNSAQAALGEAKEKL